MKTILTSLFSLAFAVLLATSTASAAHHKSGHSDMDIAPKSVIHVVTVSWKPDASEDQIQAALDGVKTLAKTHDGIDRVWIKTIKAQGDRSHAFVMEFKSEQALADYAGSPEQKKWYEVYIPARGRSTTFDITN